MGVSLLNFFWFEASKHFKTTSKRKSHLFLDTLYIYYNVYHCGGQSVSFVFTKDVGRICLREKQEDSFRNSFLFIWPSHRQFIHDSIDHVDELAPNHNCIAKCWVFNVHRRIYYSIETVIFFQVHARIGVIFNIYEGFCFYLLIYVDQHSILSIEVI